MTPLRATLLLLILAYVLVTAGCTMLSGADNRTVNASGNSAPASIAKYPRTLAQPEDSAKMIKMDTDVYNIGEVVDFVITNEKSGDLACSNDPPSFFVRYQKGSGQWVTRMGEDKPAHGTAITLKPGGSTAPYRFVTDGWAPGRYQIVTDCGVSREILLRELSSVIPAATSCVSLKNTSPFIRVNPLSNQYAGEPFTISGTTSLAAGEELRYSIFALLTGTTNITSARLISSSTIISEGSCGINTWFVEGVIKVPGDYFIGISSSNNSVSAVKRFTVLEKSQPTDTATLPVTTKAPGITTG
jgi:uncharacterized cupredoxin-like copper-binding protein